MFKSFGFCVFFLILVGQPGLAATARNASNFVSANTYNNLYPYMNNKMRTNLNPGVNPSQTNAQIDVLARTIQTPQSTGRRVVARSGTGTNTAMARNANNLSTSARSATGVGTTSGTGNTARRVVSRGASSAARSATGTGAMNARSNRSDQLNLNRSGNVSAVETGGETLSAARCLADYTDCMNGYCQRENTSYNRCYCSAKLAQIDAQYQPAIDSLIKQILTLKGTNHWTNSEMNEYWMDVIGKHTGDNSWVNLDNALNIDWAGTESRVRGQQAFATGHEYCVQHLRGCYYMAANLRDAYRSEIARDCATYESSLQRIKNAADSIVEAFK